jgi:protein O-mannosyl-transferase
MQTYLKATALDPNFKMGSLGLIHLSCRAGLSAAEAEIDELTRRLRETPFAPGDRTVLYAVKEMAIAGTLCLSRPEVNRLFFAALANPSVSSGVRAMLYSWHADYFWLRERDLLAAKDKLRQSLTLNPSNLSNRLKWAQLLLLSGDEEQARQLLLELRAESFPAGERRTIDSLLAAGKIN